MTGTYDRGNETSRELTEVRTVLTRAETALISVERSVAVGDYHQTWKKCFDDPDTCTNEDHWHRMDPEAPDIARALAEVVASLDRWRRTGQTSKSGRG